MRCPSFPPSVRERTAATDRSDRFSCLSVRLHIRSVDFHADRLTDQIDREHQPRMSGLAYEPPGHALQRSGNHFDHLALTNERARVVLQLAFDEAANPVDLLLRDR